MSRIHGVVCDSCQKVDAVSVEEKFCEDLVPRNGWVTLYISGQQLGDKAPEYGKEIHACSMICAKRVIEMLDQRKENNKKE